MRLATSEIGQRRPHAGRCQYAQIDLKAAVQLYGRPGRAMAKHARDLRHADEGVHDRGCVIACDQQVDVADGGTAAPYAAGDAAGLRLGQDEQHVQ